MTKKLPLPLPPVRHATEWHGWKGKCRIPLVDMASMSLAELADVAKRGGFRPSDACLVLQHEQGRAYVSGDGECDASYAEVDSCEYSVDLVFESADCKYCQEKLRTREAALVKRKADRKTARQRRRAA